MDQPKFQEAFSAGIRKASRNSPNTQSLISADNLRALSPYGLVDFVDVTQPITDAALTTASITKAWPFPQLFRGKGITLLADASAIFTVTESATGNWTVAALTVYDWTTYNFDADTANADTITAGKSWQFLDLWEGCWMLFNGTGIVFKTGFSSKVFYQESVTIKSGANYQDARVFYGGFNPSDTYALTDWATYWATYKTHFPGDYAAKTLSAGLGTNWVWWSNVGMEDMWWLFDRDFMVYGTLSATPNTGFDSDRPYWKSVWGKRQEGAMPMPWSGTVLHLQQLGDFMMVYGTNGISVLDPFETSFGLGRWGGIYDNVGVMAKGSSRAAIGGDETTHCFLDEAGDLNIIEHGGRSVTSPRLSVQNLERRQLFSSMTAPMISHDPELQEFWIGENDNMYVLTKTGGLSRAPMAPTSLYFGRSNSASGSIGITIANSSDLPAFQTEWFEFDAQSEVPQIASLTLVGSGTWSLGLKYRRFVGDSDQSTGLTAVDNGGNVEMDVGAVAFSIYGSATARSGAKVFDVLVEMKDGTRRSVLAWLS